MQKDKGAGLPVSSPRDADGDNVNVERKSAICPSPALGLSRGQREGPALISGDCCPSKKRGLPDLADAQTAFDCSPILTRSVNRGCVCRESEGCKSSHLA